ncbi:hypothetical protein COU60_01730 [Candidatus Pacearchaeota archaeon CG10_big_fil_rev_8_21_14_0_10_34_76]|nr:MAG: hypothetical protein COU60_01730 [Candidatus Pacearchaeota archaeon CG10_big_fil_rev_8_21_14_0_10_34_76]
MLILRILGAIDLIAASTFLMLIFGISPFTQLILFSAGLLFLKGMFIITGDLLSAIDIIASLTLIVAIFFTIPSFLIWSLALILTAKGFVSFI